METRIFLSDEAFFEGIAEAIAEKNFSTVHFFKKER